MLVIKNIENAIEYLSSGALLAKYTKRYLLPNTELQVAGKLMGLDESDWWYVVLGKGSIIPKGIIEKTLFDELYSRYYIKKFAYSNGEQQAEYYILNKECAIQEVSRYQHQIESWQEMISSPELCCSEE